MKKSLVVGFFILLSFCQVILGDSSTTAQWEKARKRYEEYAKYVPKSYFRQLQSDNPNIFSVIIPAHNVQTHITTTLYSVKESILYYFARHPSVSQTIEVIVVDDLSTDNTSQIVNEYIKHQIHEEEIIGRLSRIGKIEWKLIQTPINLFAGAARNLGVLHSKGEILFFLDADDLYYVDHIDVCINHMLNNPKIGILSASLSYLKYVNNSGRRMYEPIQLHSHWKSAVALTHPNTKSVWRSWYEFMEGFPEGILFRWMADVTFQDIFTNMRLSLGLPVWTLSGKDTVAYILYEGNAFEGQLEKWKHPPDEESLHDERQMERYIKYRDSGERDVRLTAVRKHHDHISKKFIRLNEYFKTMREKVKVKEGTEPLWTKQVLIESKKVWEKMVDPVYAVYSTHWKKQSFISSNPLIIDKEILQELNINSLIEFENTLREMGKQNIADLLHKLFLNNTVIVNEQSKSHLIL